MMASLKKYSLLIGSSIITLIGYLTLKLSVHTGMNAANTNANIYFLLLIQQNLMPSSHNIYYRIC